MKRYHLIGIGGVGMSALAEALLDAGAGVSGSERFLDQGRPPPVLDILRRQGARIAPQDGSGVVPGLTAVVASSAIESDNPDLMAAAIQRQDIGAWAAANGIVTNHADTPPSHR